MDDEDGVKLLGAPGGPLHRRALTRSQRCLVAFPSLPCLERAFDCRDRPVLVDARRRLACPPTLQVTSDVTVLT